MTTVTYKWGKIFAYVWNNELSKQELSNIGIDITDRKWRRLFGKSPNQANYFFCNKCENRHTIIPTGPGEFLALDESDRCEKEYQVSEQDLQLFMFKKLTFIQDLREYAFDLQESRQQKMDKICWILGNWLDCYKIFFVHGTDKFELLQALIHIHTNLTPEEHSLILLGISPRWFDAEIMGLITSFRWYIIFLEDLLYIDGNGFVRSNTPLQQLDSLKDLFITTNASQKANIIDEALKAFIKLDEKYKAEHPKTKPPYPMKVLYLKYKRSLSVEEIAELCNCAPRKIWSILNWIPDSIKKAYQDDLIKPGMRSLQTIKQTGKIDQDFGEENFPYQDLSAGDSSRIWASIR